jgi:hypothetical protein
LDHLLRVGGGFGSSTTTTRRRTWIVCHYNLEEDLVCLPQVGGGLAAVHQRAPISADYSDFVNDALPLSNGHQGLMVPPTWSGGPGHRNSTESSKLPSSAHLSKLSTWSGRLGHWTGTESSKLPDPNPPFYIINPDNLSGQELFQEGRILDSLTTTSPSRGHSATRRRLLRLHN